MTPGERRRRFRKHRREDGWETFREEYAHLKSQLLETPHPKNKHMGTAWNYVEWCIDNGHTAPAFAYLRSL